LRACFLKKLAIATAKKINISQAGTLFAVGHILPFFCLKTLKNIAKKRQYVFT
jgi:hypothetical protein